MNLNLTLVAQILLVVLLLTFLWVQLLRIIIWMVQKVIEWTESESGGKKRGVIRILRRLLLDPL